MRALFPMGRVEYTALKVQISLDSLRPAATLALALALVLVAACGEDAGPPERMSFSVDHSQCTPPCTLERFDVVLQRDAPSGGRCTFHERKGLAGDLTTEPLDLTPGQRIHVGLAGYCKALNPSKESPPSCCSPLSSCISNPPQSDPQCLKPVGICPGPNWTNLQLAKKYHTDYCRIAASCVRCYALAPVSLAAGGTVKLTLKPSWDCLAPGLQQKGCP